MRKKTIIPEIILCLVGLLIMNLPTLIMNLFDFNYIIYTKFNPFLFSLITPFYLVFICIFISRKNQTRYPIIKAVPSIIILLTGNCFDILIYNFFNSGTDSVGNLLLNYRAVFGILVVTVGLYIYQTILLFKRKER